MAEAVGSAEASTEAPTVDQAVAELAALAGQLNAVNARIVRAAATVVSSDVWSDNSMRSPAADLAWRLGLSSERAQLIKRVADRIDQFPTIAAASSQWRSSSACCVTA